MRDAAIHSLFAAPALAGFFGASTGTLHSTPPAAIQVLVDQALAQVGDLGPATGLRHEVTIITHPGVRPVVGLNLTAAGATYRLEELVIEDAGRSVWAAARVG